MDEMIRQIAILFPDFERYFAAGFMVFARLLGFIRFAPILNRKEINTMVKLALALLLTMILTPILNPAKPDPSISPILLWLLNFAVGAIIGYIAQLIILAIEAGGDMINTQMGLSSAMVMDPTTNSQTSILSRVITLLAICIFINISRNNTSFYYSHNWEVSIV